MRRHLLLVVLPMVAFNAGCLGFEETNDSEEFTADVDQALEIENALNPNALNPNALNPNALNPNALNPNALNPNALNPNALTAIQDPGDAGQLSRTFMKYLVSCAFDSTQVFVFSWTNSSGVVKSEVYRGLLGLATSWETTPLDTQGQMMVSACLASRANYYGIQVTISSRSSVEPLKSNTTPNELYNFDNIEGAFWGNLFATEPYLQACYRSATVSYARSVYRECAAGHLNADGTVEQCGMIEIVGPCGYNCAGWSSSGQHFLSCGDVGQETANVITVGLR